MNFFSSSDFKQKMVPVVVLVATALVLLGLSLIFPPLKTIVDVVMNFLGLVAGFLVGLMIFILPAALLAAGARFIVALFDRWVVPGKSISFKAQVVNCVVASIPVAVLACYAIMFGSKWQFVEGVYWFLGSFTLEPVKHKLVFEDPPLFWLIVEYAFAMFVYWISDPMLQSSQSTEV